jgi:ketosteroid isomerase-like protein
MKLHHVLVIAVVSLACWNSVARADEEADRAALRMIRTNYMDAVNSGDLTKIKNDLATNVTGVMVTGKAVEGYEGLVAYWNEVQQLIGPGGSYHVNVNVDKTELFGDITVSHGTTDESVRLPNGTELNFNGYWTAVCHKEGDAWKVVRMEATMDPVHNVFVTLQLKRAKLAYGIGGLVVGIVLVLLIRLICCRKCSQTAKT